MFIIEFLKSVFLGIVEGITEWLPISSTGHMIIVNDLLGTDTGFFGSQIYLYVIQFGAILAVATLFFNKLNPFSPKKSAEQKKSTWNMWFKILVACLPAAVFGLTLNDFMDRFSTPVVVAAMLIIYGIGFLFIENKSRTAKIGTVDDIDMKTALIIGLFQVLSIIPGTSRSGSTILGAMLIGCSRNASAEFSFFLAIPVMVGVSFLKIVTNDYPMLFTDWWLLIAGMVTAYAVSLASVRFLMNYVKKHDFKVFGIYRIVLGIVVILYTLLRIV